MPILLCPTLGAANPQAELMALGVFNDVDHQHIVYIVDIDAIEYVHYFFFTAFINLCVCVCLYIYIYII